MIIKMKLFVPGKIILLGEYAVCYGKRGIVGTIDKYLVLETSDTPQTIVFPEFTDYCDKKFGELPFYINISDETTLARGKGYGYSSALSVGCVMIYLSFWKNSGENKDLIFKEALQLERTLFSPLISGIDTAASLYGGLFAYENGLIIQRFTDPIHISVIETDKEHSTKQLLSAIHPIDPELLEQMNDIVCKPFLFEKSDRATRIKNAQRCNDEIQDKMINYQKCLAKIGIDCAFPGYKATGSGHSTCIRLSTNETYDHCLGSGLLRKEEQIPLFLLQLKHRIKHYNSYKQFGFSSSPSNIALIKYWGKDDKQLQYSLNSSLSITLGDLRTNTIAFFSDDESHANSDTRINKMIYDITGMTNIRIKTENLFPSSCGIASSASGFSALCGAIFDLLNLKAFLSEEEQVYWLENWSRICSGSAVRSLYDGIVKWDCRGNAISSSANKHGLIDIVVIIDDAKKSVTSSDGHNSVKSSPLQPIRLANVESQLNTLTQILESDEELDWTLFASIVEGDALLMHSIAMTSAERIRYISDATTDFIKKFIRFRNESGIKCAYTIDAGANVHLIADKDYKDRIVEFVRYKTMVNETNDGIRIGCCPKIIAFSGKRFSGKSYISSFLSDKYNVVAIGDLIKQEFSLRYHVELSDLHDRVKKENYRTRLIEFRESFPHTYWLDKLDMRENTIIADVRSVKDMDYLKKKYKIKTIRIESDLQTRNKRGFVYNPDVDALPSECNLDDYAFDKVAHNNGDSDIYSILFSIFTL